MAERKDDQRHKGTEGRRNSAGSQSKGRRQKSEQTFYLGCLTKKQLIIISVAVGLCVLLVICSVTAVLLTRKSESVAPLSSYPTDGDMLDFLVESGVISERDGLLASWYHRANSKEEMNNALTSDSMILEADVTLEGYGTANETQTPIMAHPPDIYSDNTLDQWLHAVLASRKGIKLDFKALASVGPSLDLLRAKNSSSGINRPVWLNADILRGPNVPVFMPQVNGTRFIELIQERFPDVTLSPGWMVAYAPPLFVQTYTREMVEEMYSMIKDVPQKVTFPVHALLVQSGWQHLSWLLSQSSRFSLTLWQGATHPNVSDLLFVRDNSHPARVYYDIYEPTLTEFKEAAGLQKRVRRFYPGGDLMDFLHPAHHPELHFLSTDTRPSSLEVQWFTVRDRASLLAQLTGAARGMLVFQVTSDGEHPRVPLVEGSGENSAPLTLQEVLILLGQRAEAPWGLHLKISSQQLLEASLELLQLSYSREELYRPVWVSMEGSQSEDQVKEFVSTVERLFPYVTLVLQEQKWPPEVPSTLSGVSQRVALHLRPDLLPRGQEELNHLRQMMDKFDFVFEEDATHDDGVIGELKSLMTEQKEQTNTNLYLISNWIFN